jgi:hypothetical protein
MTLLLLAALCDPTAFFAQAKLSTNSPLNDDQSLKLTTVGDGYMFGRHAAFRTYETHDHTEALVWYGQFRSEQEARNATKQSLKEHKVTRKEQVKDLNGHVIGDRIVAAPKQEKKAFMVIRKHGLNYWIIQSVSLAVAMQVDGMIEPAPPQPGLPKNKKSPSSCDRSGEFLSKQQQWSKEEQKQVHQIRAQGMVKILVNANGDVVSATAISANKGSLASSVEAVDALQSQARSMKFKPRPGCETTDTTMSFTLQGN